MANHVSSHLQFVNISEEGRKIVEDIGNVLRTRNGDNEHSPSLGFAFTENIDDLTRTFMCDYVGAKWAYLDDWENDYMSFESAWSPVEEFVEYVVGEVAKVDESVIAKYTYEDEMPNFIGVQIYTKDGLHDAEEMDSGEILENLFDSNPDLKEEYSEDDGFTDKGHDILWEVQWGFINDWQEKTAREMMDFDE